MNEVILKEGQDRPLTQSLGMGRAKIAAVEKRCSWGTDYSGSKESPGWKQKENAEPHTKSKEKKGGGEPFYS